MDMLHQTSGSPKDEQFENLHLGKLIKDYIEQETPYTKTYIATQLGLTRTCFSSRLNSPFYGNTFDLMKVSILLEKDFLSPCLAVMRASGTNSNKLYTEKEYAEMMMKLAHAEKKLFEKERELNLTHELLEKYRLMSR